MPNSNLNKQLIAYKSLTQLLQITPFYNAWHKVSCILCIVVIVSCDDQPRIAQCESDDDCRQGYKCDLETYVGECVQRREVIGCGDQYCSATEERCVQNTCILLTEDIGVEIDAEVITTEDAEVVTTEDAEVVTTEEWLIEAMLLPNTSFIVPDTAVELSGTVQTGNRDVPQNVDIHLSIISTLDSIDSPNDPLILETNLELSSEGIYSTEFNFVTPGIYSVELSIKERRTNDQTIDHYHQLWTVRVDDFVDVQGGHLSIVNADYKYFGVSLPDLIPWLNSLSEETRMSALQNLWRDLKSRQVNVARIFVGWTQDPLQLRTDSGEIDPQKISLLEQAVYQAGLNGIKLILVLADGRRELDSLDAYLQAIAIMNPTAADQNTVFTQDHARASLLSWSQIMLTHQNSLNQLSFSEDPAILGWELLHLPRWDLPSPLSRDLLERFLIESQELLSEHASKHLIFTGEVGLDYNPTPYQSFTQTLNTLMLSSLLNGTLGGSWSTLRDWSAQALAPPNIVNGIALDGEALYLNTLTQSSSWLSAGQAWIRGHALANVSTNRPLVIHLARADRAILGDEAAQMVLTQWTQEALSQGLKGIVIGDFYLSEQIQPSNAWLLNTPEASVLIDQLISRFSRP